jgi:glycosyltransferase involved in cell wall biosynthesis
MHKVLVLFQNYGPYHLARLSAFKKHCFPHRFEVIGLEFSRSHSTYPWQTEVEDHRDYLKTLVLDRPLEKISNLEITARLILNLNTLNPDVIAIAGYVHPAMLAALCWSRIKRRSSILMSVSKEDDATRSPKREYLKRLLLKNFDASLVGGQTQKRYLVKLGKASESIFTGYNVVGNDVFHPDNIGRLPSPLVKPYFLAVNRFIPKKNLLLMLDSYVAYRQAIQPLAIALDLVLSGDGLLRILIEQKIKDLGIQDVVHLPGFLQQQELLPYFAHASCFVHASTQEQWGLVINEAMAAGLPVIVSNRCGCFEDLIIEGINGFGFDPTNQQQLTDLMLKVSSNAVDLNKMGAASLTHIQNFSPDYFAQGLKQAVDYVLS